MLRIVAVQKSEGVLSFAFAVPRNGTLRRRRTGAVHRDLLFDCSLTASLGRTSRTLMLESQPGEELNISPVRCREVAAGLLTARKYL